MSVAVMEPEVVPGISGCGARVHGHRSQLDAGVGPRWWSKARRWRRVHG